MNPAEAARMHRDAARRYRSQAARAASTVDRSRAWMLAFQRVLAVRELRRRNPRAVTVRPS